MMCSNRSDARRLSVSQSKSQNRQGKRRAPAVAAAVAATSAMLLGPSMGLSANAPITLIHGVTTVGNPSGSTPPTLVTTINGQPIMNDTGGIFIYGDGGTVGDSDGQGIMDTAALFVDEGGTANNSGGNYFGSTLITLNGGTFEYHGGPVNGTTPSTTVTNMAVTTSGFISTRPQGGGGTLAITNLTVQPNATVTFASEWAPIGGGADLSADIGKVLVTNLNGKPLVNQNGGTDGTSIIGGWATVVSYGGPTGNVGSGNPGFASVGPNGIQEVVYQGTSIGGSTATTDNIQTQGEQLDGNVKPVFEINSLVSVGAGGGPTDVTFINDAQLIIDSGGLAMGQGGHWLRSDPSYVNGSPLPAGTITAGAGGNYNLYATTVANGDYRIWNIQVTDNGTHPVTFIKGGPGHFGLDPNSMGHELYTGGTVINDGTLELDVGGQTGTLMPGSTVTVNSGGVLQVNAGDGLGWGDTGAVHVNLNPGGILLTPYFSRQTTDFPINMTGATLESTPNSYNNPDGNGSYSFYGVGGVGGNAVSVNATSSPITGSSRIIPVTIGLQNNPTTFNVTNGGNGVPDLIVNSSIVDANFNTSTHVLLKTGNGTMVLTAPSFWGQVGTNPVGGTQINAGVLQVGNINALGVGTLTLAGGTLRTASTAPLTSTGSSVTNFSNFTLQNLTNGTANPALPAVTTVTNPNDTLQLTDTNNSEASSAFFNTPISISNNGGFTANFTYQDASGGGGPTPNGFNPADGVMFVLQNDPKGATALGGSGGSFGWSGIANSGGSAFNVYNGAGGGRGIAFNANGVIAPNVNNFNQGANTGVDLSSGDPIQISLVYNGVMHTMLETLTDTTNSNTFVYTFYGIDYNAILGGNTAFVGFTGGTGGLNATQFVSNFTFTSGAFTTVPATDVYPNPVSVTGNSAIDMTNGRSVTLNTLAIGANNLTVMSSDTSSTAYSLSTGAVTLSGNATFTVNNSAGGGAVTFAPGAIGGAFGITLGGSGTMVLTGADAYTGTTTVTSGTLDVEPVTGSPTASSLPANSNVTNNGTFLVNAPNTTTSSVTGTGALQVGKAAGSSAALTTPTFNQASVTINPGALLALHGPTQAASVTSGLTINGNGTLDLGGNGIIVNYTGTSPLPAIQAAIATGTNGGTFKGPYTSAAITSSAAAANSALAIGYGEASTIMPGGGTFLGANVASGASAVLARTTYGGDANLDGTVNFSDYLVLQRSFGQPGNWSQGDFNGDGVVNFSDYLVLQRNFGLTYSATPSVRTASLSSPSIQTTAAKTSTTSSQSAVTPTSTSKISPLITVSAKSAASTPNLGTSSPNAATPTVTYVLSINDNGSGVVTPGSYAVYAMDSTSDGNGGIASYEVNFSGAATISSASKNGAPYGYYDDGTGTSNDVEIGFSALRKSSTAGAINAPNLTGSQDTVGANGVPFVAVYGFGQTSGNLATLAPKNSTGLDSTMAHTTAQNYAGQLLLATGTYTGAAPAFVLNTNNTPNSDGANVWVNTTGTSLEAGTINLVTQTLPAPEPSSLALMGLGLTGLMMRRRRRQSAEPSPA